MKRFLLILLFVILTILIIYILTVYVFNKKNSLNGPNNENNANPNNNNEIDETESFIQNILNSMSLEEKVGQLFITDYRKDVNNNNIYKLSDSIKEEIQKYHLGGIILFSENLQNESQIKELTKSIKDLNHIPMFLAVDSEGGLVDRIANTLDLPKLPYISTLGKTNNTDYSYEYGKILGRRLVSLGFNLDFAPVCDLENDDTLLYRSFGSNPEQVGKMISSNIKGIEEYDIGTTLKHFPGLRSSNVDTHSDISTSNESLYNLKNYDFIPFRYGIDAGSNIVMINHVTYLNLSNKNLPASLNEDIYILLRDELDFNGLIITDSLEMGAVTKQNIKNTPAFVAFTAGADLLLMPQNLDTSYSQILNAIKSGEISEDRLNQSVKRIIEYKYNMGWFDQNTNNLDINLYDSEDETIINSINGVR